MRDIGNGQENVCISLNNPYEERGDPKERFTFSFAHARRKRKHLKSISADIFQTSFVSFLQNMNFYELIYFNIFISTFFINITIACKYHMKQALLSLQELHKRSDT